VSILLQQVTVLLQNLLTVALEVYTKSDTVIVI